MPQLKYCLPQTYYFLALLSVFKCSKNIKSWRFLISLWEYCMFVCAWLCLCVVYYTVYGVTSRGTAVSLLQGNDGRGLQLSLLTRRASVCEEKTRGFDVKLRERPVSLCLSLFRKVRVCITPSIQLTVRKNKPEQFIRLSHYISPPAWLGWVRVHDWNILQVFFFLRDSS